MRRMTVLAAAGAIAVAVGAISFTLSAHGPGASRDPMPAKLASWNW